MNGERVSNLTARLIEVDEELIVALRADRDGWRDRAQNAERNLATIRTRLLNMRNALRD